MFESMDVVLEVGIVGKCEEMFEVLIDLLWFEVYNVIVFELINVVCNNN